MPTISRKYIKADFRTEVMSVSITYFVHGTTTDNEKNISSGSSDVGLSDLGVQQSITLRGQIEVEKFDVVFCSDLKRAITSARLTFEDKVPIVIDSRLRECNYGDFNAQRSSIVEPLQEKAITERFPGGESYEDVKARIVSFLSDLKQNYDGKNVAIVAHKAPQLALDALLRGKTWEQAFAEDWRITKKWQRGVFAFGILTAMNELNPWKVLSSKTVYENPWIRVREDKVIRPSGSDGIYGVIESNDSVMIVSLNSQNEVFVVRNFRYPAGTWNWEIPGGGGDKQEMLEASKRELSEETGIIAGKWDKLGTTWVCNGLMTEKMTTYLARELEIKEKQEEPDEPVVASKFVRLDEIDKMIEDGEINDGQSITALYLLKQWLKLTLPKSV